MKKRDSLRVIQCSGTEYEIEVQYGTAAKGNILKALEILISQLRHNPFQVPTDLETATRCAMKYLENVQAFDPESLDRVRGMADGAGISFDEAFALHCYTELIFNYHILAGMCTSFAVAGPASQGGGAMLGQNVDWHPDTPIDLVHIRYADGLEQLAITFYGAPCIYLTSAGIGNCTNLTLSQIRPVTTNIPFSFCISKAMRQKSLDESLAVLRRSVRGIAYFHLADAAGRIAGIESVHDGYTILDAERGVLVHANHYETRDYAKDDVAPLHIPDSFHRASRLRTLVEQHYGSLTPEIMMTLLADHDGYPHSVCTHVDTVMPPEFAVISAASVIMLPAEHKMYLSFGPPCENEFMEYSLVTGSAKGVR